MSALWADVARDGDGGVATMGHACRAMRLIEMMGLMLERPRTSREMSESLGVAIRTVQEDLLALQCWPLYVPLCRDDDGRYAPMVGWKLRI